MIPHLAITNVDLGSKIKQREICFGGNNKLKIYGTLQCKSGKRMKKRNRVFFSTENEAVLSGFRPCGQCMREKYKKWKDEIVCGRDR